ncbi:FkbM family methyltransferase [Saccharothrix sp. MB29]|nr:FkbM family methyltransferase [Saccharothrix sp. MB29]
MTDLELVELTDDFSCYVPPGGLGAGIFSEIRFIHSEVWTSRVYLAHGIDLPDDAVVLDIGAHVGLFSLFVKHEHPGATVLAFEPIPVTAQALRANLELHEVDGVHVPTAASAPPTRRGRVLLLPGRAGTPPYPEQKNRSVELSGRSSAPGRREAKRQFDRREWSPPGRTPLQDCGPPPGRARSTWSDRRRRCRDGRPGRHRRSRLAPSASSSSRSRT